jgi:hypothetical protein
VWTESTVVTATKRNPTEGEAIMADGTNNAQAYQQPEPPRPQEPGQVGSVHRKRPHQPGGAMNVPRPVRDERLIAYDEDCLP